MAHRVSFLHKLLPPSCQRLPWASLGNPASHQNLAGVFNDPAVRVRSAIELLDSQCRCAAYGLPVVRQSLMLDARWIEGRSLMAVPDAVT